jgi:hypothetical protein
MRVRDLGRVELAILDGLHNGLKVGEQGGLSYEQENQAASLRQMLGEAHSVEPCFDGGL